MGTGYLNWTPELRFECINPPVMVELDNDYNIVVVGGSRYIAPKNVTLDMVRSQWTRWSSGKNIKPFTLDYKEYEVKSGDGTKVYTVVRDNGMYLCNCVGFGFRGYCKHIKQVSI